jgi:hypothetical protein
MKNKITNINQISDLSPEEFTYQNYIGTIGYSMYNK